MLALLSLTWKYITFNKLKSILITSAFIFAAWSPIVVNSLINIYIKDLTARAKSTPYLLGSKGDRYDLVIKSLYFHGALKNRITQKDLQDLINLKRGSAIPLLIGKKAKGESVIGCGFEYYDFRNLKVKNGTLPLIIGDAVVGANIAKKHNITVGSKIISDADNFFNIAASYPLMLNITGILAEANHIEDNCFFVDTKTAWIMYGIGHGHMNLNDKSARQHISKRNGTNITTNASLPEYQEITPKNIDSFHFHYSPESLPLSSIIFIPKSKKYKIITSGIYSASNNLQLLNSETVVKEIINTILKIKYFLDVNMLSICLIIIVFITLIIMLSIRIRKKEYELLTKIGCSRSTILWMNFFELIIIFIFSIIITISLSYITLILLPNIQIWL